MRRQDYNNESWGESLASSLKARKMGKEEIHNITHDIIGGELSWEEFLERVRFWLETDPIIWVNHIIDRENAC